MIIGIDISQVVYEGTGVGRYVREMVRHVLGTDKTNTYILFGASLRQRRKLEDFGEAMRKINSAVKIILVSIPPTFLDVLWNRLHIIPITWFTGPLDIFWSSDWTQPPLGRAKGVTTIHDLIALTYPEETHAQTEISGTTISANIVAIQKRRLRWVKKECTAIFCDSQATRKDVIRKLQIPQKKLTVVYPGY